MKKIITVLAGLSVGVLNVAGQGTVAFGANPTTGLISYNFDGINTIPYPQSGLPDFGNVHVGFFSAPDGTVLSMGQNGVPDFSGWTASTTVIGIANSATPGRINSTTIFTVAPGQVNAEFEVVGWTGAATSWAQAVTTLGSLTTLAWSGEYYPFNGTTAGALGWSQPTGDTQATPFPVLPANVVTGAGGYEGLVFDFYDTPEPSAQALAGLGVVTFAIFSVLKKRRHTISSRKS